MQTHTLTPEKTIVPDKAGHCRAFIYRSSSTQVVFAGTENCMECISPPVITFLALSKPAILSSKRVASMVLDSLFVLDITAIVCLSSYLK